MAGAAYSSPKTSAAIDVQDGGKIVFTIPKLWNPSFLKSLDVLGCSYSIGVFCSIKIADLLIYIYLTLRYKESHFKYPSKDNLLICRFKYKTI